MVLLSLAHNFPLFVGVSLSVSLSLDLFWSNPLSVSTQGRYPSLFVAYKTV